MQRANLITRSPWGPLGGYNWNLALQRQQQQKISGVQVAVQPQSNAGMVCGRSLDSSVLVGGFGGLPIVNGGVGVSALGGQAYVAPTLQSGSVTATPRATPLSSDVLISGIVNNVPQDGNCNRILWLFRVYNAGGGNWTPWAETALSGLPNPPASQTASFEYAQLQGGQSYDFGICFVAANGDIGAITVIESNYTVQSVGIPTSYMIGGTTIYPVTSTQSDSIGTSSNGISTPTTVNWTCTNQPQDGSLSRVGVWIRPAANGATVNAETTPSAGGWTYYGSIPAVGVGQTSPPASGAYSFTFADLTNGLSYDFGTSYENAQGGESNVTTMLVAVTMPSVSAGRPSMPSNIKTNGPAISSATIGSWNGIGSAVPSLSISVTVSDWSGTPPAWFLGFRCYERVHGTTAAVPKGDIVPSSNTFATTVSAPANGFIDIGFSYLDEAGGESAIAWPGALSNIAVPAQSGGGNGGPGKNLVIDSDFQHASFSGGIANGGPHWNFYWMDGISFFVGQGAATSPNGTIENFLGVRPGDSTRNCIAQSELIWVQPGIEYCFSGYIDASTCTGSNHPSIGICKEDGVTMLAEFTIATGTRGRISSTWTCPSDGSITVVSFIFQSHDCTVSSGILVFAVPMVQIGPNMGPYESGPSSTAGSKPASTGPVSTQSDGGTSSGGGPATPGPGTAWNTGQHRYGNMPTGYQNAILLQADAFSRYFAPGSVNRMAFDIAGQPGGHNLIANPTFASGLSGWARFNNGGNQLGIGTDLFGGGRMTASGTLPNGDYDGYEQQITVFSNQNLVLSLNMGANVPAGCTVYCDVIGNQSATTLASLTFTNVNNMATGAGTSIATQNFSTGINTSVDVRCYIWNQSGASQTVSAVWLKMQLEYGFMPSAWVDHLATANYNRGFDANGNCYTSAPWNNNAIILPVVLTGGLTYTASTGASNTGDSTVSIYWDGTHSSTVPTYHTPSAAVGAFTSVTGGNESFTGLNGGTTYYYCARVAIATNTIQVLQQAGSTASSYENSWVNADGYTFVAKNMACSTPAINQGGGGGSPPGGGGGGSSCPSIECPIETKRGFIRAGDLVKGDYVRDFDGDWNIVHAAFPFPAAIVNVKIDCEWLPVEYDHPWMTPDGTWVNTHELRIGQMLQGSDGRLYPVEGLELLGLGLAMKLKVHRQRYRLGRAIGHNTLSA